MLTGSGVLNDRRNSGRRYACRVGRAYVEFEVGAFGAYSLSVTHLHRWPRTWTPQLESACSLPTCQEYASGAPYSRENMPLLSKAPEKPSHQLCVSSPKERAQSVRPDKSLSPPRKRLRDLSLEQREAQVAQRERELIQLQQQLLQIMRAQITQPSQDNSSHIQRQKTHQSLETIAEAESDSKLADIEARERALEQKEELLQYKRKAWLLEQKLAQAMARSPPRRRSSKPETDMEELDEDVREKTGPDHEVMQDSYSPDPDGGQLSDYSLDDPSPSPALENLRSRIKLPTRRMLRSAWRPGHR